MARRPDLSRAVFLRSDATEDVTFRLATKLRACRFARCRKDSSWPGLSRPSTSLGGASRKSWMPGTSPGMTERKANEKALYASSHSHTIDESSIRYDGWRIVAVCFLLATFGWGLGFYGQSVYVAELHRLRGWPASLISAGTTFFYLFGALLVVFVSEAIRSFGPRNCLLAGIFAMAASAVAIGYASEPWKLFHGEAMHAFGWAGTTFFYLFGALLV